MLQIVFSVMSTQITNSNINIEILDNVITGDHNMIGAFMSKQPSSFSQNSVNSSSAVLLPQLDNRTDQKIAYFNLSQQMNPVVSSRIKFISDLNMNITNISNPNITQIPNFDTTENMVAYFQTNHSLLSNLILPNKNPQLWFDQFFDDDSLLDISEPMDLVLDHPLSPVQISNYEQLIKMSVSSINTQNLIYASNLFSSDSLLSFDPVRVPIINNNVYNVYHQTRKLGIVLPSDDRNQLNCGVTENWSWQTIVSIGGYCSGTLVSPDTILTAGHCIYDTNISSWMKPPWIRIHPCSSADSVSTFQWSKMLTFKGWTRSGRRGYDLGLIKVQGNPGLTDGWKSFGYTSSLSSDWIINVAGYPADKPRLTMWTHGEKLCSGSEESSCEGNPKEKVFYYYTDTRGGQSGSGAYAYWSGTDKRTILGVHTSWSGLPGATALNTTWNRAARIRSSVFGIFCDFIDNPSVC